MHRLGLTLPVLPERPTVIIGCIGFSLIIFFHNITWFRFSCLYVLFFCQGVSLTAAPAAAGEDAEGDATMT